jgi:two-component sensor histidine kinase
MEGVVDEPSMGIAETFHVERGGPPLARVPAQQRAGQPLHAHAALDDRVRAVAAAREAISEGGTGGALLEVIARETRRLVGAALGVVLLPDDSGKLAVRASDGSDSEILRHLPLPADAGLARAVMSDGRARLVADLSDEPSARRDLARAADLGPAIFVPLKVRTHTVGVVMVANHRPSSGFTERALDTTRVFVAQIGLALDTHLSDDVRLLDAVSLQHGNARARRELERLAPEAVEIGNLLRRALDRLARTVVELSEVEACTIQLLDEDLTLQTGGSFGVPDELLRAMRSADRRGAAHPARAAITDDSAVVVVNERDRMLGEDLLRPAHDAVLRAPWEAVGCLPLATRGGNRGALCYYFSAAERRPDEACIRLIKAMAAQAAIVVENAQLLAAANKSIALEERQHLARELHDSVSQALYGISLGARTALAQLEQQPAEARESVEYVLQLAEAGLAEMRALIFALRPESLETEGLAAALVKQVDAVRARHGIGVDVSVEGLPESAVEAHQVLYRIGQEALHNAAKHAKARHVALRLGSAGDHLILEVTDDGVGFDPGAAFPGHLGLQSMRERAAAVGGTVRIESRKGTGTRVRVTVPCFPEPGPPGG